MKTKSRSRHSALTAAIITTVLLAFVGACAVSPSPDSRVGSVRFRVLGGASALTVGPDDTVITGYRVYGFGPAGRIVEVAFSAAQVTIGDLLAGRWRFVVDAENEAGIPVLSGRADVLVESKQTKCADITLTPIEGIGTLVVEIRWPTGVLQSETVSATLSGYEGTEFSAASAPLPFESSTSDGTTLYRHEGQHDAGYYMLYTEVSDPAGAPWANNGAVRIMTDLDTVVLINIETGSIEIWITTAPYEPLSVSLSASGELAFAQGDTVTVTADVAGGSPPYEYAWYLNGVIVPGEAAPEIVVGAGLTTGRYRLSLIASDGDVLGSDGVIFDITP